MLPLREDFSRFIIMGDGGLELTGVMGVVSGVLGVVGVPDVSLSPLYCSMDGIVML